jgi:hypothetical protein
MDDTLSLHDALPISSTTVTGAAVTYTNPVFKGFGLIET